jgi:anti-sigma regulatory factor (Ser/Thr protein kinase)
MAYGALPDTVPTARARTRAVLREWEATPSGLAQDILLAVTELITNAVVASRGLPQATPVRLWVCCDRARLLVQAGDESPAPPVRIPPSDDALSGRGLMVVEGLCSSWGWFPATGHGLAKIVWADFRLAPAAAGTAGSPPQ